MLYKEYLDNPLVKDYLTKVYDLVSNELKIVKQEGMSLSVVGTLSLESFLECYIRTRREIKYEMISLLLNIPSETFNKKAAINAIQKSLKEEPVVD